MEYKMLFTQLLWCVKLMREYQRMITPGTPAAIRAEAKKWEGEVDALLELHALPDAPQAPKPEGQK